MKITYNGVKLMNDKTLLEIAYEAVRNLKLPMDKGSVIANLDSAFCPSCCEIKCDGSICSWYVVPFIVQAIEKELK
jgi:hypothetical protein